MDRATATNRARDALTRLDDASFASRKVLAVANQNGAAIDAAHAARLGEELIAAATRAAETLRDAARVMRQETGRARG